jgi:hypothetical protein
VPARGSVQLAPAAAAVRTQPRFERGGGPVIQGIFRGRPVIHAGASAHQSKRAVQTVGGTDAFPVPANVLKSGGGQPLPPGVREQMEAAFNTSFADVRIHVGNEAPSLGALAFTHGSNLYFAPGLYNPHTTQGQQLLGHELAHVLQQRAGRVRNPFGAGVAVVQDHLLEAEADRMGLRAAMAQRSLPPKPHKLVPSPKC